MSKRKQFTLGINTWKEPPKIRRFFNDPIAQIIWNYYSREWTKSKTLGWVGVADNSIFDIDVHYPSAMIYITPIFNIHNKPINVGRLIGRRGKYIIPLCESIQNTWIRTDNYKWNLQILMNQKEVDIWESFKKSSVASDDRWRIPYATYIMGGVEEE